MDDYLPIKKGQGVQKGALTCLLMHQRQCRVSSLKSVTGDIEMPVLLIQGRQASPPTFTAIATLTQLPFSLANLSTYSSQQKATFEWPVESLMVSTIWAMPRCPMMITRLITASSSTMSSHLMVTLPNWWQVRCARPVWLLFQSRLVLLYGLCPGSCPKIIQVIADYYAIVMSGDLIEQLMNQSMQLFQQHDFAACVALLTDCIVLRPSLSEAYCNRAVANCQLNQQDEEAFADLEESIKLNHLNHTAYFNYASLSLRNNEERDALTALSLALSSAHTLLAPNSPSSIEHIEKALHYSPNNKEALALLAFSQAEQNPTQALRLLKNLTKLEHNPQHLPSIQQCIQSLQKQHQKENSEQETQVEQGGETEHDQETEYELMTKIQLPQSLNDLLNQMTSEYNELRHKLSLVQRQKNIPITSEKSSVVEKETSCPSSRQQSALHSERSSSSVSLSQLHLCPIDAVKEEHSQLELPQYQLYPSKEGDNVCLFVEQAYLQNCQNEPLYFVFHYGESAENTVLRTALTQSKQELFRWAQWSQPFQLIQTPSQLTCTLYSKQYNCFRDHSLGRASLVLDSVGFNRLLLTDQEGGTTAELEIRVERVKTEQ